jgi:Kef-type K+ transport system membrane component KefB
MIKKYVNETTIAYIYGLVVFTLVFSGGWFSGLGGTLKTNIIMASIMGITAFLAIKLITKMGRSKD